jgi:hypothetical protein
MTIWKEIPRKEEEMATKKPEITPQELALIETQAPADAPVVVLPELMLTPEDGTPEVSTANFLKMVLQHGYPVGAVHRISPQEKGFPRIHFTDIYFHDGASHDFMGFECGTPTKENKARIMGLISALSMIPYLSPYLFYEDYIYQIGTLEAVAKSEKCLKTSGKDPFVSINYIFRPPSSICPKSVMGSEGMITLDNFVQQLSEDPHSILEEGNW